MGGNHAQLLTKVWSVKVDIHGAYHLTYESCFVNDKTKAAH